MLNGSDMLVLRLVLILAVAVLFAQMLNGYDMFVFRGDENGNALGCAPPTNIQAVVVRSSTQGFALGSDM